MASSAVVYLGIVARDVKVFFIVVDLITLNLVGSYSFSKAQEVPKGLRREMRKAKVGRWEGARRKDTPAVDHRWEAW